MTTKKTEGRPLDWVVITTPPHCVPNDVGIFAESGTLRVATVHGYLGQKLANANLMASAPALLRACKALRRLHYDHGTASISGLKATELADEAIAKAESE